ncbi:ABC transporter ATP-binding protein [Fodinicola acaciae]|uniref:ATP-binding cassette domain-containing protein n=1 Tax=Fodinicola acaciae TaxID=2681555 RepID=UPI0013CFCCE2|nr:ATP-binding cassette domain-containing protein [Fodinicola acaciae]
MEIQADGVAVRTRRGTALAPVTVTLTSGDVVALSGPPGSGHTVLSLVLAGRMRPTEGAVRIDGRADQRALAKAVRLVSDQAPFGPEPSLPLSVTVAEALHLTGRPAHRDDVRRWLDGLDGDARTDATATERLIPLLTRIAASTPGVAAVVVDAPRSANDWDAMRAIADQGVAIAVNTHADAPVDTIRI